MKCKKCEKRIKKLYYHTNRKNKKWIPVLYYCPHCGKIGGNASGKNELEIDDIRISKDYRYRGLIHEIKGKKQLIDSVPEKIIKKLDDEDKEALKETDTYDYCYGKMIKLYGLFRKENKQKWIPIFWYCVSCRKVVSKI